MAISLNKNLASMQAIRRLDASSTSLGRSFERLSTGLRINRAVDDAAGLSLSEGLRADSRIFGQAVRNINDGISLLSVREGALQSLSSLLSRQLELATQAANGVYSSVQRRALNNEAQALVAEYERVVQSTQYNGDHLLDGSTSAISIQVGRTGSEFLNLTLGDLSSTLVGDGTFTAAGTYSLFAASGNYNILNADINSDGVADLISSDHNAQKVLLLLGNGDGTFKAFSQVAAQPHTTVYSAQDHNGDGFVDIITGDATGSGIVMMLGNGDGTFKAGVTYSTDTAQVWVETGDVNSDGILDVISGHSGAVDGMDVLLGNSDGSFKAKSLFTGINDPSSHRLRDFNGDGKIDLAVTSYFEDTLSIMLGNGDGTFKARTSFSNLLTFALTSDDLDGDGDVDVVTSAETNGLYRVFLNNGDGSFKANVAYDNGGRTTAVAAKDLNADGVSDLILTSDGDLKAYVLIGNGDGTFKHGTSYTVGASPSTITFGDFNSDNVTDFATADTNSKYASVFLGNGVPDGVGLDYDLLTQTTSRSAIATIQSAIDLVSAELSRVGAHQSRLSIAFSSATNMRDSFMAAATRITDVDVAEESANLVRYRILQDAAVAVLTHANLDHQLGLKLLL